MLGSVQGEFIGYSIVAEEEKKIVTNEKNTCYARGAIRNIKTIFAIRKQTKLDNHTTTNKIKFSSSTYRYLRSVTCNSLLIN